MRFEEVVIVFSVLSQMFNYQLIAQIHWIVLSKFYLHLFLNWINSSNDSLALFLDLKSLIINWFIHFFKVCCFIKGAWLYDILNSLHVRVRIQWRLPLFCGWWTTTIQRVYTSICPIPCLITCKFAYISASILLLLLGWHN